MLVRWSFDKNGHGSNEHDLCKDERKCGELGIKASGKIPLCFALNENTLRLVTHLGIGDEDIAEVIGIFTELSKEWAEMGKVVIAGGSGFLGQALPAP